MTVLFCPVKAVPWLKDKTMTEMNVNQLLAQMRSMADVAKGAQVNPATETETVNFSDVLKSSIDKVNDAQMTAGQLSEAFQKGDPNVALSDVMISMQKASVSFQAMLQVRNKLVNAYTDIMNMPV
jgi:flagellar hook-basal body complex protein FliE